jgi:hypothetical protein
MNSSESVKLPDQGQSGSDQIASINNESVVVDLRYVFKVLVKWSWVVLLVSGYGVYSGVQDVHNFVPQNVAMTVLGPYESGAPTTSSQSGIAGGRGAAVLSLLSIPGAGPGMTPVDKMVHLASTIGFARIVQEKYGFMQRIYASKWDFDKNDWKPLPAGPEGWRGKMEDYLNSPKPRKPTLEDLAKFFAGSLQVTSVEKTPYQQIKVVRKDGDLALDILRIVMNEASLIISEKNGNRVKAQSKYLEERLSSARLIDHRRALVGLLSEQARKEMMMTGNSLPIYETIEPPYISVKKTEPNVRKLIAIPGMIGFFGTSLIIILIAVFKRE